MILIEALLTDERENRPYDKDNKTFRHIEEEVIPSNNIKSSPLQIGNYILALLKLVSQLSFRKAAAVTLTKIQVTKGYYSSMLQGMT